MTFHITRWKPASGLNIYDHPLIKHSHRYLGFDTHHGPWICGGAARKICFGQSLNTDIDVYFQNEQQCDEFKDKMLECSTNTVKFKNKTPYAETWIWNDIPVQMIVMGWFSTLEDVLNDFDLTICQFGFDGIHCYAPYDAKSHVENKVLVFHKMVRPMRAMNRILKYSAQGFKFEPHNILEFFKGVLMAGNNDPEHFARVPQPEELTWIGSTLSHDHAADLLKEIGVDPARICLCTDSYSQDMEIEFKSQADKNLWILRLGCDIKKPQDDDWIF